MDSNPHRSYGGIEREDAAYRLRWIRSRRGCLGEFHATAILLNRPFNIKADLLRRGVVNEAILNWRHAWQNGMIGVTAVG